MIGIWDWGNSSFTIVNNTISDNGYGIYFPHTTGSVIYLNNFIDNTYNVYSSDSSNIWNSTSLITYTYNGNTYTNYLGNYWSDYTGSDADGDGIGDTPYSIDSDVDNYPLMESFENYIGGGNQAPTCTIELQKNGIPIYTINVGEFFDIRVTEFSGDIQKVRFLSDESQNGEVDGEFTWTDWYDWDISKDDWTGHWDAVNKIKTWAFATPGEKEVWAEVKDGNGRTAYCSAGIYATGQLLEVPFFSQRDPAWKDKKLDHSPYTIGKYG